MENTEVNLQGDYEKPFPSRLRKLMDVGRISQQKLADFLGLKNRQSVASYCNGRSTPDLESIVKIASFFNVSTDYLLGTTGDPSPRPSAVEDLNLSPGAVQYLQAISELADIPFGDSRIYLLSELLETHRFDDLLNQCLRYVRLMSIEPETSFLVSNDYKSHYDALSAHGFVISSPKEQAYALFSGSIVTLLRLILDEIAEHFED